MAQRREVGEPRVKLEFGGGGESGEGGDVLGGWVGNLSAGMGSVNGEGSLRAWFSPLPGWKRSWLWMSC